MNVSSDIFLFIYFSTLNQCTFNNNKHSVTNLGILELILYLSSDFMKKQEKDNAILASYHIFHKMHWTLFFTLILNAIATTIITMLVMRNSNASWKHIERNMSISKYIQLRKELYNIESLLYDSKHNLCDKILFHINWNYTLLKKKHFIKYCLK